jgi:hypothetical protein
MYYLIICLEVHRQFPTRDFNPVPSEKYGALTTPLSRLVKRDRVVVMISNHRIVCITFVVSSNSRRWDADNLAANDRGTGRQASPPGIGQAVWPEANRRSQKMGARSKQKEKEITYSCGWYSRLRGKVTLQRSLLEQQEYNVSVCKQIQFGHSATDDKVSVTCLISLVQQS